MNNTIINHAMPRLRQPRFDAAAQPGLNRRAALARPAGVMSPSQLRAEVLAILG